MSPRRAALVGLGFGIALLILGLTVAARPGLMAMPLERPDTQLFWYMGRAAGISAYLALALSVLWGLLVSTGVADGWVARARSVDVHRWISAVGLGLTVGHAVVFVGDRYVSFDALDLLVPFLAPYRPVAVGLGVLGAYGFAVVFGSFWLRRRIGQRGWRIAHYLAFPTVVLVTLHGMLAGTDSGTPWMRLVYMGVSAAVLWLSVYRVLISVGRRGQASAQSTPVAP